MCSYHSGVLNATNSQIVGTDSFYTTVTDGQTERQADASFRQNAAAGELFIGL